MNSINESHTNSVSLMAWYIREQTCINGHFNQGLVNVPIGSCTTTIFKHNKKHYRQTSFTRNALKLFQHRQNSDSFEVLINLS